jgi:hypothetical protein
MDCGIEYCVCLLGRTQPDAWGSAQTRIPHLKSLRHPRSASCCKREPELMSHGRFTRELMFALGKRPQESPSHEIPVSSKFARGSQFFMCEPLHRAPVCLPDSDTGVPARPGRWAVGVDASASVRDRLHPSHHPGLTTTGRGAIRVLDP